MEHYWIPTKNVCPQCYCRNLSFNIDKKASITYARSNMKKLALVQKMIDDIERYEWLTLNKPPMSVIDYIGWKALVELTKEQFELGYPIPRPKHIPNKHLQTKQERRGE